MEQQIELAKGPFIQSTIESTLTTLQQEIVEEKSLQNILFHNQFSIFTIQGGVFYLINK